MSVVQVTALFLVLGVLGKKMAIAARKIDAVTVIDVIRHRYQSDAIAGISAAIIVLFFSATTAAAVAATLIVTFATAATTTEV